MPTASSEKARVLLVGELPSHRALARDLARREFVVVDAADAAGAVRLASTSLFDVVVAEAPPRAGRALAGLRRLRRMLPEAEIILLADGAPATPIQNLRAACFPRSWSETRLFNLVEQAAETVRLRRENAVLREILRDASGRGAVTGATESMRSVAALIERFAAKSGPVLIEGEEGTEKEDVARTLWSQSARRDGPFVVIRPAAVPLQTMAVELFGQEKGSFRGASRERRGRLELAEGGVAFIDDVAALGPVSQAALLRLIEHGETLRVGSTRVRRLDARILAGMSPPSGGGETVLPRGLHDRLSVMRIALLPLRERVADIPLLARDILRRLAGARSAPRRLSRAATRVLQGYPWPGNVRELEIVLERAARQVSDSTIGAADLTALPLPRPGAGENLTLRETQRRHVERAVGLAGGNKTRAAAMLGITRRRLYHLLNRFAVAGDERALKPTRPIDEKQ